MEGDLDQHILEDWARLEIELNSKPGESPSILIQRLATVVEWHPEDFRRIKRVRDACAHEGAGALTERELRNTSHEVRQALGLIMGLPALHSRQAADALRWSSEGRCERGPRRVLLALFHDLFGNARKHSDLDQSIRSMLRPADFHRVVTIRDAASHPAPPPLASDVASALHQLRPVAEKANQEKQRQETLAMEAAARRAEQEKVEEEAAAREQAAQQEAARKKAARENAARDRAAREQAARERLEQAKANNEIAARKRAEHERVERAAASAAQERAAREESGRQPTGRTCTQCGRRSSVVGLGHATCSCGALLPPPPQGSARVSPTAPRLPPPQSSVPLSSTASSLPPPQNSVRVSPTAPRSIPSAGPPTSSNSTAEKKTVDWWGLKVVTLTVIGIFSLPFLMPALFSGGPAVLVIGALGWLAVKIIGSDD